MSAAEVLEELKKLSSEKNREGMSRYGINIETAYGVPVNEIRNLAKRIKTNHLLAQQLWKSRIHEARILASIIADPEITTKTLLNDWVKDINSWDLCDQTCNNLIVKTRHVHDLSLKWSHSKKEFTKRAGFSLMAISAVHDKNSPDEKFVEYLDRISVESNDDRNFVKKSVNWALRQIGKRNHNLNRLAIDCANSILESTESSAKWIARNALKELNTCRLKSN